MIRRPPRSKRTDTRFPTRRSSDLGDARRARAGGGDLDLADVLARNLQRVQHRGADDDRGAVLVVVEHRDLHPLAQLALADEAFRRLDVLQVDAAEGGFERGDDLDQLVGVALADLAVEKVDVGELRSGEARAGEKLVNN